MDTICFMQVGQDTCQVETQSAPSQVEEESLPQVSFSLYAYKIMISMILDVYDFNY